MKSKNILSVMLVGTIFTSGITNVFAKDTIPTQDNSNEKINTDQYNVQDGDTLFDISNKYKVPLDSVIDSNPQIPEPDLIYPDDEVRVPTDGKIRIIGVTSSAKSSNYDSQTIKKRVEELKGSYHEKSSPTAETTNNNQAVSQTANEFEIRVAELVNQYRADAGLNPLTLSSDISDVARTKSADMRDNNYFDHTSPVYSDPFTMLKSFGINYKSAGENIAKGQKTADDVMNAWMNSEGHRENILTKDFEEIGVGYVVDNNGVTYWTQEFVTR